MSLVYIVAEAPWGPVRIETAANIGAPLASSMGQPAHNRGSIGDARLCAASPGSGMLIPQPHRKHNMTKPTGRAPGRPKGALNCVSRKTRDKAAASGMLPHEFLLTVVRGEVVDGYTPTFAERLEAAKAAAPFFAPKLSSIEATGAQGLPLVPILNVSLLSEAQLDSAIEREAQRLDQTNR